MCMKYGSASIIGKREDYAILCDARCIIMEQYAREGRWWKVIGMRNVDMLNFFFLFFHFDDGLL
jgi:hypothetical protein